MKLSFCIPTYNRCQFLKKNIDIIIRQIRELSVEMEVEILINDNASRDDTETVCEDFINNNSDIHIEYHKNEKNEGPDWNFIKAMRLARGEYSILFGDDDFLIDGSLRKIMNLIQNKEISIFLSNRICVNSEGKVLKEQVFLDVPGKYKIFDFSNEDSIRSYFFGVRTLGGIMTFITSVVYKTAILNKFPFREDVIGSNYAFLYYWWKELLEGNKLYYLNCSLVQATTAGSTNNNYGKMLDRAMVDYVGIPIIVNAVTNDKNLSQYFCRTIDYDHSYSSIQDLYVKEKTRFEQLLEPKLLSVGWDKIQLYDLKYTVSTKRMFVVMLNFYLYPMLRKMHLKK